MKSSLFVYAIGVLEPTWSLADHRQKVHPFLKTKTHLDDEKLKHQGPRALEHQGPRALEHQGPRAIEHFSTRALKHVDNVVAL